VKKNSAQRHPAAHAVRAPRGSEISCKGWAQEAALRMLMNSLDPELAGRLPDSAVLGGESAVNGSPSLEAISRSLRALENDETLLLRSGTPAGVFRTQADAPRVLISSAGAAGAWARMGTQEILAETYAIFAAAGRKHFAGNMAGKLIVSSGMGRRGGAQPLAATMLGAAILCIEIDPEQIKYWVKAGYCDVMVNSLDEALRILKNAVRKEEPAAVGLVANSADVIPELARRGVVPDLLTDQTPAHNPVGGYVPSGLTVAAAAELGQREPKELRKRALESIARHASGMATLAKLGSFVFEWGNGIREMASAAGVKEAQNFPDFYAAYLLPLYSEGQRQLRWFSLSGDAEDIRRIDRLALEMFSDDEYLSRWIRQVARRTRFQGLPARVCWLRYGQHEHLGVAINDLVSGGELKAPVVIAGNDFDSRVTASGDAHPKQAEPGGADWPVISALLGTATAASWVEIRTGNAAAAHSLGHGAEFALVADGTREMSSRIERVVALGSGLQIARLAETGCAVAIAFARSHGIEIPPQGSRHA
jgi:urocanate hydratase